MSRRRPARRTSSAALCAILATGLSACTSATPEPPPPPSTSSTPTQTPPVVVNALEPRRAMLPADIGDEYGARIGSLLFRGLSRYDAKGRLVNEVAQDITQVSPLRYRITLRKGWVFGNGEPVSATSFVTAWTYAADPAHRQLHADAFSPIAGYQAMRGLPEPVPPPADSTATSAAATAATPAATPAATSSPGPTATPSTVTTGSAAPDPTPATTARPRSDRALPTTLSGLRVVDDLTFTVDLALPDAAFPHRLAQLPYAPLPAAALADPATYAVSPVGNGPYQLAGGWSAGKEIRLLPNPSYAGADGARNGGLVFRFYPDPATTYAALRSGSLDVLDTMPLPALGRYKADLGFRAANQAVGAAASLVFPMGQARWTGPEGLRLRTAISRSIDRRALADGLFAGTRVPAGDLAAPVVDGYVGDLCGEACEVDPQAALKAVAAIKPDPVSIAYGVDAGGRPVVEAVCSALTAATGVACTPVPVPRQATLERAAALHTVTVPMLSLRRMARPDLSGFLDPRFRAGSSGNPSGYAGAAAQTLLNRAAGIADDGARRAAYVEAEKAILADLPEVPLWYVNATVAGGADMQPVRIDVFGVPLYTELMRE